MGPNERPPVGALIERLISRPQGFNLFQAISLLERAAGDPARAVGEWHGEMESVRLKAIVSLGFQPSDVSAIAAEPKRNGYVLFSPVLSLAGGQGPLPLPFTELLLQRRATGDHATADFLDIFNHRFLAFLYRSRKKHHLGLHWRSPQQSPLAACLDSLSALGLRSDRRGPNGAAVWIRHAGLLGGAPRSLTGLIALLRDRLGYRIEGSQFCGEWRNFESGEASILVSGPARAIPRLGDTAVLGRRFWHQSAGFHLEFKGMSQAGLRGLLPDGEEHALVNWLVRRYLQQEFTVGISLRLSNESVQRTQLDWPQLTRQRPKRVVPLRLGWTSWLVTRPGAGAALAPARFKLTEGAVGAAQQPG